MLIIWRGWGWIVIAIAVAAFLGAEWVVETVTGDERYYQNHEWTKHLAVAAACFVTMFTGFYLNHFRRLRRDELTGEVTALYPAHTLYYIPIEYWSLIIVIFFAGAQFLTEREFDRIEARPAAENQHESRDSPYGEPMTRDYK
ncbi:MAG: hypothetical protein KC897_02710 [Candidatus Omnitrophica bacterium]|nr:hypothetical protein [Candidatus Omnitrophota bacterium]MCB9722241.1 hypothetical protein [Candidatus Omnitrophota bacterium]